ncbi:MAG: lysostaphin resistance A-like protein [Halobacteriaceae archaeon]
MSSGTASAGRLAAVVIAFVIGVTGFVVGFGVAIVFGFIATAAAIELTDLGVVALSLIALQGIGFPVTAWGYLQWRDRDWSYLNIRVPTLREIGVTVLGTVTVLVLAFTLLALVQSLGAPTAERSDQELLTNPTVLLALIPLGILVIGPGEELLFRGIIQTMLRERFSAPTAIVLASAAFAPAHIVSLTGSPTGLAISISILFVPSLVFGIVYEYTDNLVVPALTHGLYDAVLFGLVYLSVVYAPEGTAVTVLP